MWYEVLPLKTFYTIKAISAIHFFVFLDLALMIFKMLNDLLIYRRTFYNNYRI